MAFWDRIRKWFSGGSPEQEPPASEPAAAAEEEVELVLDIDDDDEVPELLLDDEPSSLDSIDALGHAHLDLPDLIDEEEVTELGVDPDAVRARMRRSDPMFPDDEITEVTWLDAATGGDEEDTFQGAFEDAADELPVDPFPDALDETRFVEETLPVPDDSDLEPTALLIEDSTRVGEPLMVADETRVGQPLVVADETNVGSLDELDLTLPTPPEVVVEETADSAEEESVAEVTDFHLDMLAWDEDDPTDAESMPPMPVADARTGPRFPNSLQIADTVVVQALWLEHYPECDDVSEEMLHRLARCDAALLGSAQRLGDSIRRALQAAEEDELVESAVLFTGLRTRPAVRAALGGEGAIQRRQLGWAGARASREILAVVGDVEGLAGALADFEGALRKRLQLLRVGPETLADRVEAQPVEATGLHRLDGFSWLD